MDTQLVVDALIAAFRKSLPDPETVELDLQKLHRARSSRWVQCLGKELEQRLSQPENVIVQYGGAGRQRRHLRGGEFLFDVHVVRTTRVKSVSEFGEVEYVSASLLQVESEFEENSPELLEDLSKLVCGNAPLKLLVASRWKNYPAEQLRMLADAAGSCEGTLLLARLPHPRLWANDTEVVNGPEVFVFEPAPARWLPLVG